MEGYHRSVLLREALSALEIKAGKRYLDCTLGDGGHTLEILKLGGQVAGIDVDPQALERTKERLQGAGYSGQEFILVKGNFRDIKNLIQMQMDTDRLKFAGAIFDLGVSSLQLSSPERGFSFGKAGPLDMRMDPSLQIKAWDLINNLSRKELYELFKNLGEEKYSWGLATAVERTRQVKKGIGDRVQGTGIQTTKELAEIVERVVRIGRGRIHPATRVFQALRIAVNDELGALEEGLDQTKDLIEKTGCIVVISFHSLEDRIVKLSFKDWEKRGFGEVLTKKPVAPTEEEIKHNPRSRSAKMRVFKIL